MKIFDFFGQHTCNTEAELMQILNTRAQNNSNDFELRNEEQYPYLTILVSGENACVHYFRNEKDCGHYAYIEENGLSWDGFTTFYIGSENTETQISNRLVMPVGQAYIAAKAFFQQSKMTPELLWYAL